MCQSPSRWLFVSSKTKLTPYRSQVGVVKGAVCIFGGICAAWHDIFKMPFLVVVPRHTIPELLLDMPPQIVRGAANGVPLGVASKHLLKAVLQRVFAGACGNTCLLCASLSRLSHSYFGGMALLTELHKFFAKFVPLFHGCPVHKFAEVHNMARPSTVLCMHYSLEGLCGKVTCTVSDQLYFHCQGSLANMDARPVVTIRLTTPRPVALPVWLSLYTRCSRWLCPDVLCQGKTCVQWHVPWSAGQLCHTTSLINFNSWELNLPWLPPVALERVIGYCPIHIVLAESDREYGRIVVQQRHRCSYLHH